MKKVNHQCDCRACGACCVSFYDQDAFCDVTAEDEQLLGPRLVRKYVLAPPVFDQLLRAIDGGRFACAAISTVWREQRVGPLKGSSVCVCAFLQGSVLHRTSCRIYDRRPAACHEAVKPGTKICRDIRQIMLNAE